MKKLRVAIDQSTFTDECTLINQFVDALQVFLTADVSDWVVPDDPPPSPVPAWDELHQSS